MVLYTRFFRKQLGYSDLSLSKLFFPFQISDPNNKLFYQKAIFNEFA